MKGALTFQSMITLILAILIFGALVGTVADNTSATNTDATTKSYTTTSNIEDMYINDSSNLTEVLIKWDVSDFPENSPTISSAMLCMTNKTVHTGNSTLVARIANQTWNSWLTVTEYDGLTESNVENETVSLTTRDAYICVNVDTQFVANGILDNFSVRLSDAGFIPGTANTIFNTDELLMGNSSVAALMTSYYAVNGTGNKPRLDITYTYGLGISGTLMRLLIPLLFIIVVIIGLAAHVRK